MILERSDGGEPARVLGIAEDFTSRRRKRITFAKWLSSTSSPA